MSIALSLCFLSIVGTLPAFQAVSFEDKAVFNANAPAELQQFAFWLGDWEFTTQVTQKDGSKADVAGENHITVVFDGYGLLEDFRLGAGPKEFAGGSLTIFNPKDKKFHQTWSDSSGFIQTYVGGMEGDQMILTGPDFQAKNGKTMRGRLVWKVISPDILNWKNDLSSDGGATWTTSWEINYERKK